MLCLDFWEGLFLTTTLKGIQLREMSLTQRKERPKEVVGEREEFIFSAKGGHQWSPVWNSDRACIMLQHINELGSKIHSDKLCCSFSIQYYKLFSATETKGEINLSKHRPLQQRYPYWSWGSTLPLTFSTGKVTAQLILLYLNYNQVYPTLEVSTYIH